MRIGLFGGSFDPVHMGHLILAECCRERAQLDLVCFVPAAVSPLKQQGPRADDRHRLQMLQLATAGHDRFAICEMELQRGGTSYTVETLRQFRQLYPADQLLLLVGDDALADFADWKQPAEICQTAIPLALRRHRHPQGMIEALRPLVDERRFAEIQAEQIPTPLIEISASEIRQRVAAGQSVRYLLPRAVEKYIEAQGLYRL